MKFNKNILQSFLSDNNSYLVTDGTLGPLELLPTPADASLLVLLPSRLLVVTVLVVPFTP